MAEDEEELSPWDKREKEDSPLGQVEKLLSPNGPVFSQMAPEIYRQRLWSCALELLRSGVPYAKAVKAVLEINREIEVEVASKYPPKK